MRHGREEQEGLVPGPCGYTGQSHEIRWRDTVTRNTELKGHTVSGNTGNTSSVLRKELSQVLRPPWDNGQRSWLLSGNAITEVQGAGEVLELKQQEE